MQIINSDFKKGHAKIKINSGEDLWTVSQIIDPKDLVKGSTFRKIKIGEENARNQAVVKKPVTLTIEVEKVDFHKYTNSLRVSGKIVEGPEDIPKGSHHTIDVDEGSIIKIMKEEWLNFQIEKLKEGAKEKLSKVLIVAMDRDEACFAVMKKYGYEYLGEIEGKVQNKRIQDKTVKEKEFYEDLIKKIQEYVKRFDIEYLILGSPAFWKDELYKELKKKDNEVAKKVTLATCNAFGKNAINELLKRDEVRQVLKNDRIVREANIVEELLLGIKKGDTAVYGIRQTRDAAEAGAIKTLLITNKFLQKMREEDKYKDLEYMMKLVEKNKGSIIIISDDHDGGKKLNGITGIGALLRYKLY
jgi:protein pelota